MAQRHVVVTGAGTGIGRAVARRVARDGSAVTLLGLDKAPLESVAAELGEPSHVGPCDIRDRKAVDEAIERRPRALGPVHALVACAGVAAENADGKGDRFDELVATNLSGTYYTCRAAERHLAPGPEPRHIVVISSILARIGVPGHTGYCASKAGLLGLVRALAAELAPAGVQVNAVCPGWVDTEMAWDGIDRLAAAIGGTREDAYREAMKAVPLGRMTQPEEIAGTVAWLLSPDARGVTGAGDRPQRRRLDGVRSRRAAAVSGRPAATLRCLAVYRGLHGHGGLHVTVTPGSERPGQSVVIGGGVGGCSILYWLTRLGWEDVLLVERADLTSGSTFHSAGLVGQLRSSLSLTRMMMSSVELYRTLGEEVGLETGWREVGSLRLASSQERMEEIARQAGWAKTFGLPLELVSAAEAQELFPPMSTDGVLGAAYLPTDGYIDPSQLTFALAEGARRRGAEIAPTRGSTGIRVRQRPRRGASRPTRATSRPRSSSTPAACSRGRSGRSPGVTVPIVPMAHEYLVTRPSGLPARHADDARPVAARVLPARVGRADHGRLRAALRAVGAGRDPSRTSTGSCSRRTGRASRS